MSSQSILLALNVHCFVLDIISKNFEKTGEKDVRRLLINKIKSAPGQKGSPGRGGNDVLE